MLYDTPTDVAAENFRLNLRKLEELCIGAGVKADFSHILAAAASTEGLQHRREIVTHIHQARRLAVKESDLKICKDATTFMTWIATITDITRSQEFRKSAELPEGVTDEQAAAVHSLQSYLTSSGSPFKIDLARTFGAQADAAYQVQVHDAMVASYGDPSFRPTPTEQTSSHPVYANPSKLLQTINLFIRSARLN
jgi:hypothetical protein